MCREEVEHVALEGTREGLERERRWRVATALHALNRGEGEARREGEFALREASVSAKRCDRETERAMERFIGWQFVSADRLRSRDLRLSYTRRVDRAVFEHERAFDLREHVRRESIEPRRERDERLERHVGLTPLDAAHLAGVDTHPTGELLDPEVDFAPPHEANFAERAQRGRRAEGATRERFGWTTRWSHEGKTRRHLWGTRGGQCPSLA